MAGTPLRLKDTSDLQEMSDADIDACIVPLVLYDFANDQTTTLKGNCDLASGSGDYDFTNRIRNDDVGVHPSGGAVTTTTYCLNQDTGGNESVSSVVYPLRYISSGNKLQTITSAETKDHILARVANAWQTNLYAIGSYHLGTSAPDSETWVTQGVNAIDTYRQSGTDGSVTYNLRRKLRLSVAHSEMHGLRFGSCSAASPTVVTHNSHGLSNGDTIAVVHASGTISTGQYYVVSNVTTNTFTIPVDCTGGAVTINFTKGIPPFKVRSGGDGVQQMTMAEIRLLSAEWRNYLHTTQSTNSNKNIGEYAVATSAPTGTWVTAGAFVDNLADVTNVQYSGSYGGSYSAQYTGQYSAQYTGNFSGTYTTQFSGTYSGSYSAQYTGQYSAQFARMFGSSLQGQYTGTYAGTYSGTYGGSYTAQYTGSFSGSYSSQFTGTYAGTYAGTYSGTYTDQYTGATVQASTSTTTWNLYKRVG